MVQQDFLFLFDEADAHNAVDGKGCTVLQRMKDER